MNGCTISENSQSGISIEDSAPSITNNTISNNTQYGIYLYGASSTPDIFGNDIFGNSTGIWCQNAADALIGGSADNRNNIYGNTNFGVNNLSGGDPIIATYNWWGAYTGPTHAGNQNGNGDIVSDNVDFTPFIMISDLPGDMNNNGFLDLGDSLVGLQVLTGIAPAAFHPEYVIRGIDINGDNQAGLADINYILRDVAGLNTH